MELNEFQELSNLIDHILEKNYSRVLKINLLLLQGKIAFINGEISKSVSFCMKALDVAEEFDQVELIKKIKTELEIIQKTNSKESKDYTSKERFDIIEIENYVQEAFKIIKRPIEK